MTTHPPDSDPAATATPARDTGEARGGSRDQPSAHWRPFLRGLAAFVRRRVPEADAEDVTQEVLLRLHQAAGELRRVERAEAWVYGIARRTIADHYRSRAYREWRDTEALGEVAEAVVDPGRSDPGPRGFGSFEGDHAVHEEVLTWLRPLAEELPGRYRDALLMADFEGMPQAQVAERLELSVSGAKSRVQRARRMLGERLQECCRLELDGEGRVVDFERQRRCEC